MTSTKRPRAQAGSHRSLTAKKRLSQLRVDLTMPPIADVVPNGLHSEAGFKDVRTNAEKDRLLQWVKHHLDYTDERRLMHFTRMERSLCLKQLQVQPPCQQPHHPLLPKSVPTFICLQPLLQD